MIIVYCELTDGQAITKTKKLPDKNNKTGLKELHRGLQHEFIKMTIRAERY